MYRRIREQPTDRTDRWIFSYADFVTLLFAFFVVMYAVSTVNLGKYRVLAESLESAFKGNLTAPKFSNVGVTLDPGRQIFENPYFSSPGKDSVIEKDLLKQINRDDVTVYKDKDWVEIEIKSSALFASSSAILTPSAKLMLQGIAKKLKDRNISIAIEGYTDNVPIKTVLYPSNWELSAARAAAVARELEEDGIVGEKISAVGYGENFPIADNSIALERQKNRRVVIIISRGNKKQRLLNPGISASVRNWKKHLESLVPEQPQQPETEKKPDVITVPIVQSVRTKKGGLKFTRGTRVIVKQKTEQVKKKDASNDSNQ